MAKTCRTEGPCSIDECGCGFYNRPEPTQPATEQHGGDVLQKVRDVVTAWNWGPVMTDRDAMVAIFELVGDNIQSPTAAP